MPGSKTTPGLAGARNDAPASVAFCGVNNVSTRVYNAFTAQWLAYTLPCRRFAVILAEDCARIGSDVGVARSPYFVTAIRGLQTFRLLHARSGCFRRERIAGFALHPLESAALSRRTWKAEILTGLLRELSDCSASYGAAAARAEPILKGRVGAIHCGEATVVRLEGIASVVMQTTLGVNRTGIQRRVAGVQGGGSDGYASSTSSEKRPRLCISEEPGL
jgi:hypothetical protein